MTNLDCALAEEHLLLWEHLLEPSAEKHVIYGAPKEKDLRKRDYVYLAPVKE